MLAGRHPDLDGDSFGSGPSVGQAGPASVFCSNCVNGKRMQQSQCCYGNSIKRETLCAFVGVEQLKA